MSRPQLGNNRLQLQGFMENGQAIDMAASAWINEPKERKGDPAARAAIEQIHDILLQHQLTISTSVAAKKVTNPAIGRRSDLGICLLTADQTRLKRLHHSSSTSQLHRHNSSGNQSHNSSNSSGNRSRTTIRTTGVDLINQGR